MPDELTDTARKHLRGFEQHGVHWCGESATQFIGDCPFCQTEGHFYALKGSGDARLWDCKHCGAAGNFSRFLEKVAVQSAAALTPTLARCLIAAKGVVGGYRTVRTWGVGWNGIEYTIPVTGGLRAVVTDILRWAPPKGSSEGRGRPYSTTGGRAGLIVSSLEALDDADEVWLCEGPWDAFALWGTLPQECKGRVAVVAVPGASVLPRSGVALLAGKEVRCAYDHDKAGEAGAAKASRLLEGVTRSLHYIHWPTKTPEGWDVRDYLADVRASGEARGRRAVYASLEALLAESPPATETASVAGRASLEEEEGRGEKRKRPVPAGLDHVAVARRFRKWLEMPNAEPLEVLFGACYANRLEGDPLWLFLVAPPGGMKSELLLSLDGGTGVVVTTSLTPAALLSGASGQGARDPSLLAVLDGRILVIKDFTTILSLNRIAKDEIFGTLRDVYDGRIVKRFGTGVVRKYHCRFGLLAGVTPAIGAAGTLNTSLGERFLRYRLPSPLRLRRQQEVIRKALRNISVTSKMRAELARTSAAVLQREFPSSLSVDIPSAQLNKIIGLAQWVAALRGVVSKGPYTGLVEFNPMREVGTRLARQLAKLAMGIAIYKSLPPGGGEPAEGLCVDAGVYRTVAKVARDTVPDRVEALVRQLFVRGKRSDPNTAQLARWCRLPQGTVRSVLEDLTLLRVVEPAASLPSDRVGVRWKLTQEVLRIMRDLELYHREAAWEEGKE